MTAQQVDAIAALLARAGLHRRALAAWAGTDRIAAARSAVRELASVDPTPAAAALALFVAGVRLPRARLGLLGADVLDELGRRGLLELDGDEVRSTVAVIPHGSAYLICDHATAGLHHELVCWPDDSSHHLAAAIPPGRRARWLDLGCGSAFAPLARPELASEIVGVDVNPRAIWCATEAARLAGLPLRLATADLRDPPDEAWRGAFELVTCNAPIPDGEEPDRPVWRSGATNVVDRAFAIAADALAPGGMFVAHAALDALVPLARELPGECVVIPYTPDDLFGFGVVWWRPDGEPRFVWKRRALTADQPHLTFADREAALGNP